MANLPECKLERRYLNGQGETFSVHFKTEDPAAVLRALWSLFDIHAYNENVRDGKYFLGELTDRMREFRTTVQDGNIVCIRTHAGHPLADTHALHPDVLKFLYCVKVLKGGELQERLASYAHNAWSGWMKHLFDSCRENGDGSVTIPQELAQRWKRQMGTDYEELPGNERESDREQADCILNILNEDSP